MKKLLVVVDYQNDFVNGALGFAGAETLEPGIKAAVEKTLDNQGYVIFTRDTHARNYLTTREGAFLPVEHCIAGTPGHQLYGSLHAYEEKPRSRILFLNKETFGCSELPQRASELCGGVPDLIEVCGLVTDICVVSNAIILYSAFPETPLHVLGSLCGSGNAEGAAAALAVLKGLGIPIQ